MSEYWSREVYHDAVCGYTLLDGPSGLRWVADRAVRKHGKDAYWCGWTWVERVGRRWRTAGWAAVR